MDHLANRDNTARQENEPKKVYSEPKLERYGDIVEMTRQVIGGSAADLNGFFGVDVS